MKKPRILYCLLGLAIFVATITFAADTDHVVKNGRALNPKILSKDPILDKFYKQPSDDSREKQKAELLKLELENEKLGLENKGLEQKLLGKEKPSRWEIIRTSVTWIGVVVPVLIAVFTYFHQHSIELEQRSIEAHDRRVREMNAAMELIGKGDRSAGTFQLSLFGKDAIPLILGEVRVNNFHIDWPSTTLAALVSLKRIGINKLKAEDIEFLRHQGDIAEDKLRNYKPNDNSPDSVKLQDTFGLIRIINSIQEITGKNADWSYVIEQFQRDFQQQTPAPPPV